MYGAGRPCHALAPAIAFALVPAHGGQHQRLGIAIETRVEHDRHPAPAQPLEHLDGPLDRSRATVTEPAVELTPECVIGGLGMAVQVDIAAARLHELADRIALAGTANRI